MDGWVDRWRDGGMDGKVVEWMENLVDMPQELPTVDISLSCLRILC